jgi:hypothetical protein
VDEFKLGKLNHNPKREVMIDWPEYRKQAVKLMEDNKKHYIIKKDLLLARSVDRW